MTGDVQIKLWTRGRTKAWLCKQRGNPATFYVTLLWDPEPPASDYVYFSSYIHVQGAQTLTGVEFILQM